MNQAWGSDWIARGARLWGDTVAVIDDATERSFTYADLDSRAHSVACRLRDQGVQRGDHVALLAGNGVVYLDLFFACSKLGATFVPLNWRLSAREVRLLLTRTAPKVVVVDADRQALLDEADVGLVSWTVDDVDEAARAGRVVDSCANLDGEDIACLLFTGGTTATPKAARISHRMIGANAFSTIAHELERGDSTVLSLPMFHAGGLLVYTLPLLSLGGRVVLTSTWDAGRMLTLIERERPGVLLLVPTQCQDLLDHAAFDDADLSSLRFVTSGGAPLPVSLVEGWRSRCAVPFKQGFGMTEFGPGCFSMTAEQAALKTGSIGRPNFLVDVKLIDDAGDEVAPGDVGELCLRGPASCSGYTDDDATRATWDDDGWLHTGDLLRQDADGFFFVAGRKKEMFISGGENVYPAEIEAVLLQHPDVSRCAVVGVPDAKWGEVGKAVVVAEEGKAPDAVALKAFLKERLASFKVPKHYETRDALPLTSAGKVLRRALVTSSD